MPAILVLLGTLFAWIAVYQGTMAYVVTPPEVGELVAVEGRIDDVATPVTRNRTVAATQVTIEVAPVRFVTVSVRRASLDTAELKALTGRPVSVRFAGARPRNRWVYELVSDGKTRIALAQELDRDASERTRSLQIMVLAGLIAAGLFLAARRIHARRKTQLAVAGKFPP